jgi:hypothetical protein
MTNSKQTCFFITPLGEESSDIRANAFKVYKHIIQRALEKTNFEAQWPLDIGKKPERITKEIIKTLAEAPLVIADLTNLNPNVFYELAIRHATGKPVIQIIQKETKLPFDVQEISTPFYDLKDPDIISKCVEEVKKQIKSSVDGKYDKEVYTIIRTQESLECGDTLKRDFGHVTRTVDNLRETVKTFETRLPEIKLIEEYRDEISILKSLRESGVICPYRNRDSAIQEFYTAIDAEASEIMITGSSLLGLLQKDQYKELARKLEHKSKLNIHVKLLLTHPKVADLRAEQEGRKFEAIGQEIIKSLQILRNWEVPPEVRLYLGTPTIFAIKTKRKMLLNFYAYKANAFESPCLIVSKDDNLHYVYFYDEYDKAHFGAWDSSATEVVSDYETAYSQDSRIDVNKIRGQYDNKISELQANLSKYSERIASILKDKDYNQQ